MADAKRFCSILRIKDNVVIGIRGDLTGVSSLVVPEGVVRIETCFTPGDLDDMDTLTSITLPDTLTHIGERAFSYLLNLGCLKIPDAVTSIGSHAFANSSIGSITLPANLTHLGPGAFKDTSLFEVTLPDGLEYLSEELFCGCEFTTSITLPRNLKQIGKNAFVNCAGLTSLILPNTVTRIGSSAFYNCLNLSRINFPDGLTTIGEEAFAMLPELVPLGTHGYISSGVGLKSLSLPHVLTSVGKRAFKGCTALTSAAFRPRVPDISPFIAWAVGNSRNRANWQLTTVKRLRNVLRLITALAFELRDISSVDPEGRLPQDRAFKGCTRIGFDDYPETSSDSCDDVFL